MMRRRRRKEDAKEKRNKRIVAIVITLLFITSTAGFLYVGGFGSGGSSTVRYNGHKLRLTQQGYQLETGGREYVFAYAPPGLETIQVEEGVMAVLDQPVMTITYDPQSNQTNTLASLQFSLTETLRSHNDAFVRTGLTKESEYDLPVVTCQNATAGEPVILLERAEETKVALENNCVKVQARTAGDLIRAHDRLSYLIIGVMEQ